MFFFTGAKNEYNSTAPSSAERIASYCYHCANCPLPFNPYSSSVTQDYTSNGWCAVSLLIYLFSII